VLKGYGVEPEPRHMNGVDAISVHDAFGQYVDARRAYTKARMAWIDPDESGNHRLVTTLSSELAEAKDAYLQALDDHDD